MKQLKYILKNGYDFSIITSAKNLINSSAINQCYTNPHVEKRDKIVTIETGNDFNCYEYYENLFLAIGHQ